MRRSVPVLLVAVIVLVMASVANGADAMRARVHSGVLVGTVDSAVAVFKGIPYAAPPVESLRWKLPQPVPAWSGERAANDFGASCMQHEAPHSVPADS